MPGPRWGLLQHRTTGGNGARNLNCTPAHIRPAGLQMRPGMLYPQQPRPGIPFPQARPAMQGGAMTVSTLDTLGWVLRVLHATLSTGGLACSAHRRFNIKCPSCVCCCRESTGRGRLPCLGLPHTPHLHRCCCRSRGWAAAGLVQVQARHLAVTACLRNLPACQRSGLASSTLQAGRQPCPRQLLGLASRPVRRPLACPGRGL